MWEVRSLYGCLVGKKQPKKWFRENSRRLTFLFFVSETLNDDEYKAFLLPHGNNISKVTKQPAINSSFQWLIKPSFRFILVKKLHMAWIIIPKMRTISKGGRGSIKMMLNWRAFIYISHFLLPNICIKGSKKWHIIRNLWTFFNSTLI